MTIRWYRLYSSVRGPQSITSPPAHSETVIQQRPVSATGSGLTVTVRTGLCGHLEKERTYKVGFAVRIIGPQRLPPTPLVILPNHRSSQLAPNVRLPFLLPLASLAHKPVPQRKTESVAVQASEHSARQSQQRPANNYSNVVASHSFADEAVVTRRSIQSERKLDHHVRRRTGSQKSTGDAQTTISERRKPEEAVTPVMKTSIVKKRWKDRRVDYVDRGKRGEKRRQTFQRVPQSIAMKLKLSPTMEQLL